MKYTVGLGFWAKRGSWVIDIHETPHWVGL